MSTPENQKASLESPGLPPEMQALLGLGMLRENEPVAEALRSWYIGDLTWATREAADNIIIDPVYWAESAPSSWKADAIGDVLDRKVRGLRRGFIRNHAPIPKEIQQIVPIQRRELASQIEGLIGEFWGKFTIANQVARESGMGGDVDQATEGAFKQAGKPHPLAYNIREVLRAPRETELNMGSYGAKVDECVSILTDIGMGQTGIIIPSLTGDEEFYSVPNLFSLHANTKIRDAFMEGVVIKQLRGRLGEAVEEVYGVNYLNPQKEKIVPVDEQDWKDSIKYDDLSAAKTAWLLMRFFRLDTAFAWSYNRPEAQLLGVVPEYPVTNNDIRKKMDAYGGILGTGTDVYKLIDVIRRYKEWWGKDHPRSIGAPATIFVMPTLFTDMLHVASFDQKLKTKNAAGQFVDAKVGKVNVWEVWRNHTEDESAAVIKRLEEDKSIDPVTHLQVKGPDGRSRTVVQTYYVPGSREQRSLAKMPWDEGIVLPGDMPAFQALLSGQNEKGYAKLEMGIDSDIHEISYGLMLMYLDKIWQAMTRGDFVKLYRDSFSNVDQWRSLNKAFDVGLGILCGAYGIENGDTLEKFRDYCKIMLIGGELIALNSKKPENGNRQADKQVAEKVGATDDEIRQGFLEGVAQARFLDVKPNIAPTGGESAIVNWQTEFLKMITTSRSLPLPGDIRNWATLNTSNRQTPNWVTYAEFNDDELEFLKPLYPFGIQSP